MVEVERLRALNETFYERMNRTDRVEALICATSRAVRLADIAEALDLSNDQVRYACRTLRDSSRVRYDWSKKAWLRVEGDFSTMPTVDPTPENYWLMRKWTTQQSHLLLRQ